MKNGNFSTKRNRSTCCSPKWSQPPRSSLFERRSRPAEEEAENGKRTGKIWRSLDSVWGK